MERLDGLLGSEQEKEVSLQEKLSQLTSHQQQLHATKQQILQEKEAVEGRILNINMKHMKFSEKKDSNENDDDEIRKVLLKDKELYESRLHFTVSNSAANAGARVLVFTHIDERRVDRKFTVDISITADNKYKIHSINPEIIPANKLQKIEDKLNETGEFKGFVCYMRNQFKNSVKSS